MHVLAQQTPAGIQESRLKVFNKLCNFSCKFLIPSSGCLIFNSHWKCKHLHLKPNESSSNCHPTENSLKNSYEINCEFIKMGLKWRGNGVRNSCRILLIKWHIRYEWRSPILCTTSPKQTEGNANNWNHPHTHTQGNMSRSRFDRIYASPQAAGATRAWQRIRRLIDTCVSLDAPFKI